MSDVNGMRRVEGGAPAVLICQNCKQRPGKTVSFDMDLPAVTLCEFCRLAVQMGDLEMFDELHATGRVRVGTKTKKARTGKGILK